MSLENSRTSASCMRIDLVGACLCGLAVGYVLWLESISSYKPNYRLKDYAVSTVVALCSYIAMTFVAHRVRVKKLRNSIPRWIVIALFGSILIVIYFIVSFYITAITNPSFLEHEKGLTFDEIIFKYIKATLSFFILFTILHTIIALPIMAAVHFVGRLFRSNSVS